MDKGKQRRIGALKALSGWMNIEMSELRREWLQADARLHAMEEKLLLIDNEISAIERRARAALDPGANLVLEEYRMLLAYLDQQQRIRINHERQQDFVRSRLARIEGEMTQQGLKMRGVENLLERRRNELRNDTENKQLALLDEAWLQR